MKVVFFAELYIRMQTRRRVKDAATKIVKWLKQQPKLLNVIDPFTLEPVEPPFFTVVDRHASSQRSAHKPSPVWIFNAMALAEFVKRTKNIQNPFTSTSFSTPELNRLRRVSGVAFQLDEDSECDENLLTVLEEDVGDAFQPLMEQLHDIRGTTHAITVHLPIFVSALSNLHSANAQLAKSVFDRLMLRLKIMRDRSSEQSWVCADSCALLMRELVTSTVFVFRSYQIQSPSNVIPERMDILFRALSTMRSVNREPEARPLPLLLSPHAPQPVLISTMTHPSLAITPVNLMQRLPQPNASEDAPSLQR